MTNDNAQEFLHRYGRSLLRPGTPLMKYVWTGCSVKTEVVFCNHEPYCANVSEHEGNYDKA